MIKNIDQEFLRICVNMDMPIEGYNIACTAKDDNLKIEGKIEGHDRARCGCQSVLVEGYEMGTYVTLYACAIHENEVVPWNIEILSFI